MSNDASQNALQLLRVLGASGGQVEKWDGAFVVRDASGALRGGPWNAGDAMALVHAGSLAPVQIESGRAALRLTAAGREAAMLESSGGDAKRVFETRLVEVAGGEAVYAPVNVKESPLAWLRSRAGGMVISDEEYAAGERLREDFTLAQMAPRMTVDLTRPYLDKHSIGNGAQHVGDRAIAARRRVAEALASAGPGLSDALVSVCCFLQGMEECERERQWPRRSAKLVLKFALQRLAAHYGGMQRGGKTG